MSKDVSSVLSNIKRKISEEEKIASDARNNIVRFKKKENPHGVSLWKTVLSGSLNRIQRFNDDLSHFKTSEIT